MAAVVFTVRRLGEAGPQAYSIVVAPLDGGKRKLLVSGATCGTLLSSGHHVYSRDTNLMGVGFDLARLEAIGGPAVLVASATPRWAVSDTGTLVYEPVAECRSTAAASCS